MKSEETKTDNKRFYELLDTISNIKGIKIITIFHSNGAYDEFDMTETKIDGGLEAIFAAKILDAITYRGSIIIRQFTDEMIDKIPVKNLYGIRLQNMNWYPLSEKELEIMFCIDSRTGKRIPKEKYVKYCTMKG